MGETPKVCGLYALCQLLLLLLACLGTRVHCVHYIVVVGNVHCLHLHVPFAFAGL